MVATKDIRLAEETVRDLRAQGQAERAAALEAILAAVTAPPPAHDADDRQWTVGQAARTTGLPARLIRQWMAGGRLPAVIRGGQTLVLPADLWACIDALPPAPAAPPPSPEEVEARRQQHERLVAGLPAEKVARQEALLEKVEDGRRLTRSERVELIALEKELVGAATQVLKAEMTAQRAGAR